MRTNYPLILVFYLDRDLMTDSQIIKPFSESVNTVLAQKNANAIAFFLPTDGEEKVECINPITVNEADMEKINILIEDIKKNFSIESEEKKPCICGKNLDGDCSC